MNKKYNKIIAFLTACMLMVLPVITAFGSDINMNIENSDEILSDLNENTKIIETDNAEKESDESNDYDDYLAATISNAIEMLGIQPFSTNSTEDIQSVIYTNAPVNSPDLYVTKITQDIYGDIIEPDNPDTRFTFFVKFNDELANQIAYTVYNSDGEEVYLYSDGESTESKPNKLTFRTDKYGTFTLKAGQTARFEYVGTGVSYEVYEEALSGWTQIYPVGDSTSGTVTKNGETVEFVNVTSDDSAHLVVYKTISFPDGYQAPETPEFTFKISISNKPYAKEKYTIIDLATSNEVGMGMTDSDGVFTLRGGQEAIFDVAKDVDYKVEELLNEDGKTPIASGSNAEGWRITSASSYEGTTGFNQTVIADFNNAAASFAVSKHVQDSDAGDEADTELEFTFVLFDADRNAMPNMGYYLYHTNGTPYYDENGNVLILYTDNSGCFKLKHGQTAIFFGIDTGTFYNVREIDNHGYTQIVPTSNDGYMDKTVSDTVEILPFINEAVKLPGNLIVSKAIQIGEDVEIEQDGEGQDVPLEAAEFTFILYKENEDGEYDPVANAEYTVNENGKEVTYTTDERGQFTIWTNESAVFSNLENGGYKVKETRTSADYYLDTITTNTNGLIMRDTDGTGTLDSNGDGLMFTFMNTYDPNKFAIELIKSTRNDELLEGAEFMLFYDANLTNSVYKDENGDPWVFITDADGSIMIWDTTSQMEQLETGTYYLVETKSPEGYNLLAAPIEINIRRNEEGTNHGFVFTINGTEYTEESTDTYPVGQIWVSTNGAEGERSGETVHITIYNDAPFTIPLVGGVGIALILIIGLAGICLISYKTLRKKG